MSAEKIIYVSWRGNIYQLKRYFMSAEELFMSVDSIAVISAGEVIYVSLIKR